MNIIVEYQLVDFSMKWLYKWAICPVENGELLERAGRKASDLRGFGNFNYSLGLPVEALRCLYSET